MNNVLSWLDLSSNKCGDDVAVELSKVMNTNTSLVQIILSSNLISSRGGEAICTSIENNKYLQVIDLSYNPLTDSAAVALAYSM